LKVSPYNVGRTVTDVSSKTWIHGTRQYLRPDSMYADERYNKVTQAEINAARKIQTEKFEKRMKAKAEDDKRTGKDKEWIDIKHKKPQMEWEYESRKSYIGYQPPLYP